jgi:hypothetical protein
MEKSISSEIKHLQYESIIKNVNYDREEMTMKYL